MKCVECGQNIIKLFEEPLKGNIALVNCENCGKIADKFIEYEYTLIFLNLILCKTQVYRHILFNIEFCNTTFEVFKLFVLSCLMDCVLYSCNAIECWALQFLASVWRNFLYLAVIIVGAIVLDIKFNKLSLVRAILVASFGKLGAFMIVTWKYSPLHRGMMSFFIYLNNILSIKESLSTSYLRAFSLVVIAVLLSSIESSTT